MIKNRIALKLLVFFAAALLFFALVSSLMFRRLFTESIKESKQAEMLDRASYLSGMLSQALAGTRSGGAMMGGQGGGYANFVRLLTQAEPNLWVLDENLEFLSSGRMMGMMLEYKDLPPDAEQLVRDVFRGGTSFSEGFSELAGALGEFSLHFQAGRLCLAPAALGQVVECRLGFTQPFMGGDQFAQ